MANVLISHICLALILSRVESCLIPNSVYIIVPKTILPGSPITTVEVSDCDTESIRLMSSDPSFSITSNGVIEAVTSVSVAAAGRTFSVRARDSSGPESEMVVHLVHSTETKRQIPTDSLKRSKRRWGIPPFNILENYPGPFPKDIDMIVSDSSINFPVYYTISGPGVDEEPKGLFSLNQDTAVLTMHSTIDREQYPKFTLKARVFKKMNNEETDLPLNIIIEVDDVNDNAPIFREPLQFTVPEQSIPGTVVGKVNATDRDLAGSLHVKIRYFLKPESDLFAIDPVTGVITTKTSTLDREVNDKQMVTVEIRDLDGASNGLFNTATATITLGDINDNPPTFTETSFSTSAKENENEKLILRIPVKDKDLINTPNWISQFIITKGNENGNFRMATDPETNDGLLYIAKPLDCEHNQNVKLEIMARNEADLTTNAQWLTIPVDVNVIDEDEGPEFSAPTIRLNVKENTPNDTVIGTYTALDPETRSINGIKYYKVTDPASWINVDRNTGQLRVANTLDRESHFVQDGIYNITMRAVDASSKTGTGTVIIVLDDENDEMPTIPTSELLLCEKQGQLGSVLVTAVDNDQYPNSSPFSFRLADDADGKWSVKKLNDTVATLQQLKDLPTGIYHVSLDIKDLQGSGQTQTATVRICNCKNGVCLTKPTSTSLGPMGILTLLLPLLLLLLLGLLLAFFCATKRETKQIDDMGNSGGILLKSNTESPGEEVDSSLIKVPATFVESAMKGSVKGSMSGAGWMANNGTLGAKGIHENGIYNSDVVTSDIEQYYSDQYNQYGAPQFAANHVGSVEGFDNRFLVQDSTLLHNWQTNGRYINKKLAYFGTEEDGRYADDVVHAYGFEGKGSAAGSVGCCSNIGDNDNLDFLNTLGPKFKTLGSVCRKT
ncbi:desmocollin 2-like protein [Anoplopoma fimbria]|uniref:desmocollin 2-like protein n=1 Tax=Anoplopoma fimbria TaxID=229290 RepID=UPI0023EDF663|nr:desmocollin 2-like protein [Anoplopoma fimbria]